MSPQGVTMTIKTTIVWPDVKAQIAKDIEALRDTLETCSDPLLAAEVRGRIKGLRDLIKEMERITGDPSLSSDHYGKR